MNYLRKQFRIYFFPLIFLLLLTEIAGIVVAIYLRISNNLDSTYVLGAQALVTILTTFGGIMVPLWISRNFDKEKDRRTLAFTLGLVWKELLFNEYIVEMIDANFNMEEVLTYTQYAFIDGLHSLKAKLDSINYWFNLISDDSFISSQSSGAIKTFNDDNLFESVILAYESAKDLDLRFKTFLGNSAKNTYLLNNVSSQAFDEESEIKVKDQIKNDITLTKREIYKAKTDISSAISLVDSALNKLGVKTQYYN